MVKKTNMVLFDKQSKKQVFSVYYHILLDKESSHLRSWTIDNVRQFGVKIVSDDRLIIELVTE